MTTDKNSAREIAELAIINSGRLFDGEIVDLARAYLELGKDYEKIYSDYTNLLNSGQAKEIARLREENERLKK